MVGRVVLGLIISSILMVSGLSAENTGLGQDEIAIRKAIESYYSFALSYDSDRLVKRRVSNFELLWCSLGSREIPGMK